MIVPINRGTRFSRNFPNELKDKKQLQRFLRSLNYIAYLCKGLALDTKTLFEKLKKNLLEWNDRCTKAIEKIKVEARGLPCLNIPYPTTQK